MVRRVVPRIHGNRPVVSIASRGVLFSAANPGVLLAGCHNALGRLCERADVYVIHAVADDAEWQNVRDKVTSTLSQYIDPVNVLFCQTELGRASMVRQLESTLHIDASRETVAQVAIFHTCVLVGDMYGGKTNCPVVSVKAFGDEMLTRSVAFPFM